jgi:hypothetical protein
MNPRWIGLFFLGSALATWPLSAQTRQKRIAPVDGNARQNFERQVKVAILGGVGHYPAHSRLTELHYPARDVELLAAELKRQGYTVVSLEEQEATRGAIEQALRDAAQMVDAGAGTVLFFFSGHGFTDHGDNYLASFEATASDLSGTGLALSTVERLLKATGARRQVMLIDACRNEAGKSAGTRTFDRFQAAAGLRVLFSTKLGSISYEDDALKNGVFAHFLVEAFRGAAAGNDGLITFRDLTDYVTDAVRQYSFQNGRLQIPYEGVSEAVDDFLLARTEQVSPPVTSPPPPAKTDTPSADATESLIEPPAQAPAYQPRYGDRYPSKSDELRSPTMDIKRAMTPHPTLGADLDKVINLAARSELKTIKAMKGHWANEQYGWYYSAVNIANAEWCHVIRDSGVVGGLRFGCRWFMQPDKEQALAAYRYVLAETSSAVSQKYPSATIQSSEKRTEFHLPSGVIITLMLGSDPPGVTLVKGVEDLILTVSPAPSKSKR